MKLRSRKKLRSVFTCYSKDLQAWPSQSGIFDRFFYAYNDKEVKANNFRLNSTLQQCQFCGALNPFIVCTFCAPIHNFSSVR